MGDITHDKCNISMQRRLMWHACEQHVDIGVTCMYLYVCKCSSTIKTTLYINTGCRSKCTHVTQFVAYIYGEYCMSRFTNTVCVCPQSNSNKT